MKFTEIQEALKSVIHPEFGRSIVDVQMLLTTDPEPSTIQIDLLTYASPVRETLSQEILAALGPNGPKVEFVVNQRSTQPPLGGGWLPSVKNVVVVASGKGGVGKSTVSLNIAVSLAQAGAKVGLFDADIYGPSVPALLGLKYTSLPFQEGMLKPVEACGLKIMSAGFMGRAEEAVVVRGPILSKHLNLFCQGVEWGELDFMVIDLPPGTGDVALTLAQQVPIGGAVIVSTPQQMAVGIANKAIDMCEKLSIPIVGLVENMSYYHCPNCQHKDDVFGHGGARASAEKRNIPFLGEVPLSSAVKIASDNCVPVVQAEPNSEPAKVLRRVTELMAGRLSVAAIDGYDDLLATFPAGNKTAPVCAH